MKRTIFTLCLFGMVLANEYDYLLFSNNYSDIRKGIDLGANVNAVLRGVTPVYEASGKNDVNILNLLISKGANPNTFSHGQTALHKAVQLGNRRSAEILLKSGANPNVRDSVNGISPLYYAIYRNDISMAALLIKQGADTLFPNVNGDTPLRLALSKVQIPGIQIQNKNLIMTGSSFSIGKGSVGISIRNPTNTPIVVHTIGFYINDVLIGEASINQTLSPRTAQGLESFQIPPNAYKNIRVSTNGIAKIKYGFSVRYSINDSPGTLRETSRAAVKLW